MIQRCEACLGKKTVSGFGGIMKQCPCCNGVGHVTLEPRAIEKEKHKRRR